MVGLDIFSTREKYIREMLNEITIMLIGYTVICFSSFVPDIETRTYIGLLVSIILPLHWFVSMGNLTFLSTRAIIKKKKREKILSAHKRNVKEVLGKKLYTWTTWE